MKFQSRLTSNLIKIGCLKSTYLKWLPVLSIITPPTIRREFAATRIFHKFSNNNQSLLYYELHDPHLHLLKSRKSTFNGIVDAEHNGDELWRILWSKNLPPNGQINEDLTLKVPGFEFT